MSVANVHIGKIPPLKNNHGQNQKISALTMNPSQLENKVKFSTVLKRNIYIIIDDLQ